MNLPFGLSYRAEPPVAPQTRPVSRRLPVQRGLTSVAASGDSEREHRLGDNLEVDPWQTTTLQGLADGGLNYGPPPRPAYKSFEIPRIFRGSMQGWAGLQQMAYIQDLRGSADGYGAYIPHMPYLYAGRGYRSISMIQRNTGMKGADRLHIPAIFVPTAPIS